MSDVHYRFTLGDRDVRPQAPDTAPPAKPFALDDVKPSGFDRFAPKPSSGLRKEVGEALQADIRSRFHFERLDDQSQRESVYRIMASLLGSEKLGSSLGEVLDLQKTGTAKPWPEALRKVREATGSDHLLRNIRTGDIDVLKEMLGDTATRVRLREQAALIELEVLLVQSRGDGIKSEPDAKGVVERGLKVAFPEDSADVRQGRVGEVIGRLNMPGAPPRRSSDPINPLHLHGAFETYIREQVVTQGIMGQFKGLETSEALVVKHVLARLARTIDPEGNRSEPVPLKAGKLDKDQRGRLKELLEDDSFRRGIREQVEYEASRPAGVPDKLEDLIADTKRHAADTSLKELRLAGLLGQLLTAELKRRFPDEADQQQKLRAQRAVFDAAPRLRPLPQDFVAGDPPPLQDLVVGDLPGLLDAVSKMSTVEAAPAEPRGGQ